MVRFIIVLFLLLAGPASAVEPTFPPGSRIGLVPPEGFVPGKVFPGFEDREKSALILMTELPASAYPELEQRIADEQLRRQGVSIETREPITLPTGPAILIIGRQEAGGRTFRRWILFGSTPDFTAVVSAQVPEDAMQNSDESMRAALATFAVRKVAPIEEQLEGLPFTIGDLAGFRVAKVLGGTAALLTDGTGEPQDIAQQPLILIAAGPGTAPEAGDRDRFARGLLSETPGIKEVRLVRAEPLRIGGQQGYEIIAEAKEVKTSTNVMVAQWIRFGGSGHLRILGMARKDGWAEIFPRLRTLRDGIALN